MGRRSALGGSVVVVVVVAAVWVMCISGVARAAIVFSELMYDAPGSNPNKRFFEVRSTSSGVESLSDVTLIAVEGDGATSRGTIDFAAAFGSVSTGTNGLALLRDSATTLNPAPAAATTVVVNAYTYNEDTTVTYLLVTGFTGVAGITDVDANNDGTIDLTPWTAVLDAVGFRDDPADGLYASEVGGVEFEESAAPYSSANISGFLRDGAGSPHAFRAAGPATGPFTVDLSATLPNGYQLTPGSANIPVPEPSAIALLAFGALAARRRRDASG